MKIWPGPVPGEDRDEFDETQIGNRQNTSDRYQIVLEPTMTVMLADSEKANGTTVLICPGGGYNILAWTKEGIELAEWFNSLGVHAVVLKYRVPRRFETGFHVPPLQDAQRALRLIRKHAKDWGVDSDRIGVMGFSAGGHLTVMAGTHWMDRMYDPIDDADEYSCRPNFMMPIYPAYLANEDQIEPLNDLVKVNAETPPAFIAVTDDDKLRGVNAAQLYIELKRAGVAGELHVYTKGGHGYGIRPSDHPVSTWHHRCGEWLKAQGYLDPR